MSENVTEQTNAQFGVPGGAFGGAMSSSAMSGRYVVDAPPTTAASLGWRLAATTSNNGVSGSITFPKWCEGGPGVVHGGMALAALDEVSGLVHTSAGILAVTAGITARFRRPVPVATTLSVVARLTGASEDGSRRYTQAEIIRGDGKLLAEASGEFVVRDPQQHFVRAAATNESARSSPDPGAKPDI